MEVIRTYMYPEDWAPSVLQQSDPFPLYLSNEPREELLPRGQAID